MESKLAMESTLSLKIKQLSLSLTEEEKKRHEAELTVSDLESRFGKHRYDSKQQIEKLQEEVQELTDKVGGGKCFLTSVIDTRVPDKATHQ